MRPWRDMRKGELDRSLSCGRREGKGDRGDGWVVQDVEDGGGDGGEEEGEDCD